MEKINDLFECAIGDSDNAFPTIFSKEDVIYILAKLRTNVMEEVSALQPVNNSCISEKLFTEFQTRVRDTMENYFELDTSEAIDYDSAEFNIEYNNQLQLQNIDLNVGNISIKLDEAMLTHIEDVFGNLLILDQE
jgi:hypothetical protein